MTRMLMSEREEEVREREVCFVGEVAVVGRYARHRCCYHCCRSRTRRRAWLFTETRPGCDGCSARTTLHSPHALQASRVHHGRFRKFTSSKEEKQGTLTPS